MLYWNQDAGDGFVTQSWLAVEIIKINIQVYNYYNFSARQSWKG